MAGLSSRHVVVESNRDHVAEIARGRVEKKRDELAYGVHSDSPVTHRRHRETFVITAYPSVRPVSAISDTVYMIDWECRR
jgi:hypothetical protein